MSLSAYQRIAGAPKWPKRLPALTEEQARIREDFVKYWHEVLPRKYSVIERFNHGYPVAHAPANFKRTLEIGAGLGEHLEHETLTPEQEANYFSLELRPHMVDAVRRRFP